MKGGIARYTIPLVIGFAPALLMALTWSPAGDLSQMQSVIRNSGATVIAAQIFTILAALKEGMLKALPRWNWTWPLVAASIVLLSVAIVTAFSAPLQTVAIVVTAYWIIHALFGLSIAYLCGRIFTPQDLTHAYIAGFAVVAVQFLFFVSQIPDWSSFNWRFGLPTFHHVRHAGLYFGPVAALAVGLMAVAKSRIGWSWAFATASVALGLSVWTGSRGALLAFVGALATTLLFSPAMRSARSWGGGLAVLALAAAVASQAPAPDSMMGARRTVEASVGEEVTTGRTVMWARVLDAIQKRPLFGYGEGQMREVAPFSVMVQPHNSILQVTLAWGLVGLLCVLALAASFARRAIPALRSRERILVPPFMALAAIGILSLYDNSLINPMPGAMFAAFAGLFASQFNSAAVRANSFDVAPSSQTGRSVVRR